MGRKIRSGTASSVTCKADGSVEIIAPGGILNAAGGAAVVVDADVAAVEVLANAAQTAADAAQTTANSAVSDASAAQTTANAAVPTATKDATGGVAGLTLFKINFKNALNTFTSFFTNSNTAARTYTFQNRDGTIADDTDLAAKVTANGAITGATKTKVTYDAKGLVTSGADATQDDIGDGTNFKQYAAADKTKVGYVTITQAVDLDAIETRVNLLDAAVVLAGQWDASAGTFPGGGTAQAGASYIVSVGGTVNAQVFAVNDRIIAILDNASTTVFASNWFKADYTDQVLSVAGRTGAVVIVAADLADFNSSALAAAPAETGTTVGVINAAASSKTTPVDADSGIIVDSEAANVIKRLTFTNLKAFLKTYFDTLYLKPTEQIIIAVSDEGTLLTTGTAKATFRLGYAFTITAVRASVNTAPTGSTIIVDINDGGTSIMTTNKLSIDVSELTSTTAATAATLTDTAIADDAAISIDIDQVGSTIAGKGLKVVLIGYRT